MTKRPDIEGVGASCASRASFGPDTVAALCEYTLECERERDGARRGNEELAKLATEHLEGKLEAQARCRSLGGELREARDVAENLYEILDNVLSGNVPADQVEIAESLPWLADNSKDQNGDEE